MIKQKIAAVLMVALTIPVIILDNDASATIFMATLAIPLFFSKRQMFY